MTGYRYPPPYLYMLCRSTSVHACLGVRCKWQAGGACAPLMTFWLPQMGRAVMMALSRRLHLFWQQTSTWMRRCSAWLIGEGTRTKITLWGQAHTVHMQNKDMSDRTFGDSVCLSHVCKISTILFVKCFTCKDDEQCWLCCWGGRV